MKRFTSMFVLLLVLSFVLVSIPEIGTVKAEPTTIVVPDDYVSIQEAIDSADEGDTILVRSGTYEGLQNQTLMINKTISLIGEDAESTKIHLHPRWIEAWFFADPSYYESPLEIVANDVRISDLTITSDGGSIFIAGNGTKVIGNIIETGLRVEGGFYLTIAENTLVGVYCYSSYSNITSNDFEAGGILVGGSNNLIKSNIITNAGSQGSSISLSASNTIIFNNTIERSYYGVSIHGEGSNNLVYSNKIIHNIYGLVATGGSNNTFYANDLVNNTCGAKIGYLEPPATNCTLHHNNFIGSTQQVSTRTSLTYIPGIWTEPFYLTGFFDNGKEGNYWSDYAGADNDGDGVGDEPYVIDKNRKDNHPLMAPFDISSASISDAFPDTPPPPLDTTPPFPITWIAAAIAIIAIGGAALLVYFAKVRKTTGKVEK